MTSEPPEKDTSEKHIHQNVGSAGRDVQMIGGNNVESRKISFNLWISVILVITLGALAYLGIRLSQSGIDIQLQNDQQPSNVQETTKP